MKKPNGNKLDTETTCSGIRCDERLPLKNSVFESLKGGQFTLSAQVLISVQLTLHVRYLRYFTVLHECFEIWECSFYASLTPT